MDRWQIIIKIEAAYFLNCIDCTQTLISMGVYTVFNHFLTKFLSEFHVSVLLFHRMTFCLWTTPRIHWKNCTQFVLLLAVSHKILWLNNRWDHYFLWILNRWWFNELIALNISFTNISNWFNITKESDLRMLLNQTIYTRLTWIWTPIFLRNLWTWTF